MGSRSKTVKKCEVCTTNDSKYTCSTCFLVYCSVPCYKNHKETSCSGKATELKEPREAVPEPPVRTETACEEPSQEPSLKDPTPLRPLTSLKWPYVPDESAYPDPLKRDDPKTLQLRHYEAIATSPSIRKTLVANPNLKKLLTSIDALRGNDREYALQRALGVAASDIRDLSAPTELDEDTLALRELAEAIEVAVRGGQKGTLGLDWDSSDL